MAETFRLRQILFNNEASFAVNTNTFSNKIQPNEATVTLTQERLENTGMRERLAVKSDGLLGPRSAELQFTCNWIGHQTTTAGDLTETWLYKLLSDGLGGGSSTGFGTTVSGASSPDADSVDVADASNFAAGEIIRIGTKGDGRCDGQAGVIASVDTGATPDRIELLTSMPATASTTGDVVYATQLVYHDESTVTSATTQRFRVMHATTNAQWVLYGCQLSGLSFNLPMDNNVPTVTLTYQAAYWERVAVAYPETSTTLGGNDAAPIAGGSFFIQDVGTTTRATATPAEMNLTVNLGLSPVMGPGGTFSYQQITGWARTQMDTQLEIAVPWTTTWETFFDQSPSITKKHILATLNPFDGRSVGFYLPNAQPFGNRPTVEEVNDQNYVRVSFFANEGPTTTNELTRSAVRFFMG